MKSGGAKALQMRLNTMGKIAPALAKKITMAEAGAMQAQVERTVPVKSGHLQRSVSLSSVNTGKSYRVVVSANAYTKTLFNYGYAQEHGTKFVKGKFFMKNAYEVHSKIFKSKLMDVMNP